LSLVTGNVLADDNSAVYGTNYVPDYITTTSVVTTVTAENGNTATIVAGTPETIIGAYGTLTINSDGTYSYQATADMANVGKVDSFTYTVTDPVTGRTDTATLHVQVGSPDVSSRSIINFTIITTVKVLVLMNTVQWFFWSRKYMEKPLFGA